jgi:hypothetical protein
MKKSRKLILHRETLHSMELRGVAGGVPGSLNNCTDICLTAPDCNENTYGYCPNTYENCSRAPYCATGGACPSEAC